MDRTTPSACALSGSMPDLNRCARLSGGAAASECDCSDRAHGPRSMALGEHACWLRSDAMRRPLGSRSYAATDNRGPQIRSWGETMTLQDCGCELQEFDISPLGMGPVATEPLLRPRRSCRFGVRSPRGQRRWARGAHCVPDLCVAT